jgi:hypothetical protein
MYLEQGKLRIYARHLMASFQQKKIIIRTHYKSLAKNKSVDMLINFK